MPLIELGQHSLASVPRDNKKPSVVASHAAAVSAALRNSLGDAVTVDDRVFGGAPDGVADRGRDPAADFDAVYDRVSDCKCGSELVDTENIPVADHDWDGEGVTDTASTWNDVEAGLREEGTVTCREADVADNGDGEGENLENPDDVAERVVKTVTVTVGVGVVLDADDDVLAVTLPLMLLVSDVAGLVEGETLADDKEDNVTLALTVHDGVCDGDHDHDGGGVTEPELVGSALMVIGTVTVLL